MVSDVSPDMLSYRLPGNPISQQNYSTRLECRPGSSCGSDMFTSPSTPPKTVATRKYRHTTFGRWDGPWDLAIHRLLQDGASSLRPTSSLFLGA